MDRSPQRYINGRIETTLYRYPTRVEGAGLEDPSCNHPSKGKSHE